MITLLSLIVSIAIFNQCIVERIKKAHEDKERFRIIVIMPLLPGFEADLNFKDAGTIR